MADYEALTALIDYYGLKKEGKIAVVDNTPGLVRWWNGGVEDWWNSEMAEW